MPSINLKNNELDFTPTFGTQQLGIEINTYRKNTIVSLNPI